MSSPNWTRRISVYARQTKRRRWRVNKRYPLSIELHVLMWKIFTRRFVSFFCFFFIFWLGRALFESSTFWHTYDKLCDRKCSNIQFPHVEMFTSSPSMPSITIYFFSVPLSFYVRLYFLPLITHQNWSVRFSTWNIFNFLL